MRITKVPFAVLSFQYRIARFPLQLIEDRVVGQMDAEAPARLLYERSLGALDAAVGNVLGDQELASRGSALAERSDALSGAARIDAAARRTREHADQKLAAAFEDAGDEQKRARDAEQQKVQATLSTAAERKRAAAETAASHSAAEKKQADVEAAQRLSAIEEAKRGAQSRIKAAENQATASAASKIDDARAKRDRAEGKRAQADRIEQLADDERQNRRAARANKD
jgi:hypothetical protein